MNSRDKRAAARHYRKIAKQLDREAVDDEFKEWVHEHFRLPFKERIAFLRADNERAGGISKDFQDLSITGEVDRLIREEKLSKTSAFKHVSKVVGFEDTTVAKIYYKNRSR